MTTEIVIVNGDEAYYADVTSITNVLDSEDYFVHEDLTLLKGFDSTEHALTITTAAGSQKILATIEAAGGYAIWKIYTQETGEPELLAGYLTIEDGDGKVVKVEDGVLTDATTSTETLVAMIVAALTTGGAAAPPDDADEIAAIATGTKDKIKIAVEE